jgi:hypothetical protein
MQRYEKESEITKKFLNNSENKSFKTLLQSGSAEKLRSLYPQNRFLNYHVTRKTIYLQSLPGKYLYPVQRSAAMLDH